MGNLLLWRLPTRPQSVTYIFIHVQKAKTIMTKYRDFVYIRADPDPIDAEPMTKEARKGRDLSLARSHLAMARGDGFNPERRDKVLERVSALVAASGRPKFNQLMRKLGPSTRLVVWRLDGLGRDAADVLKTIRMVNGKGAVVHCVELAKDDLFDSPNVIATLAALARLDRKTADVRGAMGALGRGAAGGRIGRPPTLDEQTQDAVRTRLAAGEAVAALARRYNTSRQTILRIRSSTKTTPDKSRTLRKRPAPEP